MSKLSHYRAVGTALREARQANDTERVAELERELRAAPYSIRLVYLDDPGTPDPVPEAPEPRPEFIAGLVEKALDAHERARHGNLAVEQSRTTEKPRRRWVPFGAVAVGLAAAALLWFVIAGRSDDPRRVAVADAGVDAASGAIDDGSKTFHAELPTRPSGQQAFSGSSAERRLCPDLEAYAVQLAREGWTIDEVREAEAMIDAQFAGRPVTLHFQPPELKSVGEPCTQDVRMTSRVPGPLPPGASLEGIRNAPVMPGDLERWKRQLDATLKCSRPRLSELLSVDPVSGARLQLVDASVTDLPPNTYGVYFVDVAREPQFGWLDESCQVVDVVARERPVVVCSTGHAVRWLGDYTEDFVDLAVAQAEESARGSVSRATLERYRRFADGLAQKPLTMDQDWARLGSVCGSSSPDPYVEVWLRLLAFELQHELGHMVNARTVIRSDLRCAPDAVVNLAGQPEKDADEVALRSLPAADPDLHLLSAIGMTNLIMALEVRGLQPVPPGRMRQLLERTVPDLVATMAPELELTQVMHRKSCECEGPRQHAMRDHLQRASSWLRDRGFESSEITEDVNEGLFYFTATRNAGPPVLVTALRCFAAPDSVTAPEWAHARNVLLEDGKPWGVGGVLVKASSGAPRAAEELIDALATWAADPAVRKVVDSMRASSLTAPGK